jgi:hypothetical protein
MSKIIGAHTIIYTNKATADRKFFSEVLKLKSVDVGGGWLIYGLPPSEVAFHPGKKDVESEFYLMVNDIEAFVEEMKAKNIRCGKISNQGWGLLSEITLPGGGMLSVYEPRHARPNVKPKKKPAKKYKRQ